LEKDLKEVSEYYQNHYFNDKIADRIKHGVHKQIHRKQFSFRKKLVFSFSAAVAAFGLFIGLAFVSPSVAALAANIPYLKMLFDSKPINDVIMESLEKKGYKVDGMSMIYWPKKTVSIYIVGPQEYVDEVSPDVEQIVQKHLSARNFDAYAIEIEQARTPEELTPEEQKEMEQAQQLLALVGEVLKTYGHGDISFGISATNKEVELTLPNTETRVEEIKQQIQSSLSAKNFGTFTFTVDTYDVKKKEREVRWMPILSNISEGIFGNSKFKVIGSGYTNRYDEYMQIQITTSASSSDADYQKVIGDIENTIVEFLNSEETKEIIKNDAYKVIITSNDKKEHVVNSK
jgi:hypothetical protein